MACYQNILYLLQMIIQVESPMVTRTPMATLVKTEVNIEIVRTVPTEATVVIVGTAFHGEVVAPLSIVHPQASDVVVTEASV